MNEDENENEGEAQCKCGTCDHSRWELRGILTCARSVSPRFAEIVDADDDGCLFWE